MAEFKINRIRFTWKSDWATGTAYTKDDIVRYGGKSYVCLVGHTASADFNTDLEFIDVTTNPDTPDPKWQLWFDGYEWKNNWSINTLYDLGDYVKYGSIIYICVDSHTSATTTAAGLEADQAKWIRYAATDDWRTDWTTNRRYKLNDIVRYGGTLYRCNLGHTSAGSSTLGLEQDLSKWDSVTFANDWKTDWTANTRYKLGDVVRYGGIVYKCVTGHTSAISNGLGIDPDIAKWTIVHNGIDYKFSWVTNGLGYRYKLNDIVKYGADLYICTTAHIAQAEFDTDKFTVWIPGLQYADAWDAEISYVKGDIVTYGGYQYTSNVTNNLNNIPSTDLVSWTLLVKNYNVLGEWSPFVSYKTGDLLRRDGYLYVAVADSAGTEPTDTDYWELVNPGIHWKGAWTKDTTYVIGDVVYYRSTSYICLQKHFSSLSAPPLTNDVHWVIYIRGDQFSTLQYLGDIQTIDNGQQARVPVGQDGNLFQVNGTSVAVPGWDSWGVIGKIFYVAASTGQDIGDGESPGTYGTTISTPWKTVRYACEQLMELGGPATIFVKTGTYGETLPISIPAGVALVGDELRGTVIQPKKVINCIATASSAITNLITVNTTVGIEDGDNIQFVAPILLTNATGTEAVTNKITLNNTYGVYVGMPVVFTGAGFGNLESNVVYYILTFDGALSTITVSTTPNGTAVALTTSAGSMAVQAGGFANLDIGRTYYVIGDSITDTQFSVSSSAGGSVAVQLSTSTDQTCNVYGGDAIKDMFYVRNATGIRNMTLKGLLGGLGTPNNYGTRRPTGGAYTSLDPGTGPNDSDVHIITKSPYTQNVSLFGQGCVGMKIDGTLHNGGNRSIVANDYTTLISDGIGVWCTGPNALTELVSVFAYYSHCGYLAEDGGRIRATNGNTSYGTYGCVAEGFDTTEAPLTGTVNNRDQQAQVASAFIGEATNKLIRLEYSNAGQNYTGASFTFGGAGQNAAAIADEFRDGAIYEARITGTDFGAGGTGYISAANQAQAGNTQTITIASNDLRTLDEYYQMRVMLTSGTGVGQYGYIAYYDTVSKIATIGNESVATLTSTSTNSSNNTIAVTDTSGITPGTAIVLVPNQQTTTAFNSIRTIATITGGYTIGNTLYVKTMGAGAIAVGMVLVGAGIAANTYIVANNAGTGAGSTWQISTSQTVGSFASPIAITGTNNLISLTSSNGMVIGEQITFTGTTFGGLVSGQKYYIANIIENRIAISDTYLGSVKSISNGTGSMTAVAGGMLGGLTAGLTYYVIASNYTATTFSVSETLGGTVVPVTTQTYGTKMQVHAIGWEHILAGTPAAPLLDSTTVYSIEASVKFSTPQYTATAATLPSGNWVSTAYGNGRFISISDTGSTAYSIDGSSWSGGASLPPGTYTSIAFGAGFFVAVCSGTTTVAYSADGSVWTAGVFSDALGAASVSYGNNRFIALPIATSNTGGKSTNTGDTWTTTTLPAVALWKDAAYGSIGVWVAIAGDSSNVAAYSTNDGDSWTATTLPATANWVSVAWGNGRFVAVASGSTSAAYSFDGITWITSTLPSAAAWNTVNYGQGVFVVVGTSTGNALSSQDGLVWTNRILTTNSSWKSVVFGNPNSTPVWAVTSGTTAGIKLVVGAKAFGRAVIASGKVSSIKILEPGSGYSFNSPPTVVITDPNTTAPVTTTLRYGNGVLGNPTFTNRGVGYRTSTTTVTVSVGDGFADIYQPGKYLVVSGLASLPTPGAALTIDGNANQYRVVVINDLGGGKAEFQISPPLTITEAPEHQVGISVRQKYSQCRITGHDFLLVGTGNQTATNYPYTDVTTALSYQQIAENNGGRVFQTSTDQDGNFKVGNLFQVEQASGIVTISADQLSLEGLQTLSLGGFSLGTNTVTITQFSTDSYFTANSDTIVPTQRAIKTYIARNIAGGGSNAQAGAVVAGTFGVGGPNKIYSSTQTQLYVRNSMRMTKGINGTMLSKSFFAHGFSIGGSDAGK